MWTKAKLHVWFPNKDVCEDWTFVGKWLMMRFSDCSLISGINICIFVCKKFLKSILKCLYRLLKPVFLTCVSAAGLQTSSSVSKVHVSFCFHNSFFSIRIKTSQTNTAADESRCYLCVYDGCDFRIYRRKWKLIRAASAVNEGIIFKETHI